MKRSAIPAAVLGLLLIVATRSFAQTALEVASYNEGVVAYNSGDTATAIARWTPIALGNSSLASNAAMNLAAVQLERGDYPGARALFLRAASLPSSEPGETKGIVAGQLLVIGAHYYNAKEMAEARSTYEAALKLVPQHRDALYNVAMTLYVLEDWPAADKALREAIAVDPLNSNLRITHMYVLKASQQTFAAAVQSDNWRNLPILIDEPRLDGNEFKFVVSSHAAAAGSAYVLRVSLMNLDGTVQVLPDVIVEAPAAGAKKNEFVRLPGEASRMTFSYTFAPVAGGALARAQSAGGTTLAHAQTDESLPDRARPDPAVWGIFSELVGRIGSDPSSQDRTYWRISDSGKSIVEYSIHNGSLYIEGLLTPAGSGRILRYNPKDDSEYDRLLEGPVTASGALLRAHANGTGRSIQYELAGDVLRRSTGYGPYSTPRSLRLAPNPGTNVPQPDAGEVAAMEARLPKDIVTKLNKLAAQAKKDAKTASIRQSLARDAQVYEALKGANAAMDDRLARTNAATAQAIEEQRLREQKAREAASSNASQAAAQRTAAMRDPNAGVQARPANTTPAATATTPVSAPAPPTASKPASTDTDANACVTAPEIKLNATTKGNTAASVMNGCGQPVDVRICLLTDKGWNCGVTYGLVSQARWSWSSYNATGRVFMDARTSSSKRPLARPN